MLISVNGTIIDTKNIYKIGNIQIAILNVNFIITSINNNELKIEIKTEYPIPTAGIGKEEYGELVIKSIEPYKLKLSEFRDSIIKIWQENQSEIPQFNL